MSPAESSGSVVQTACVVALVENTCTTPASFEAVCPGCEVVMPLCVYDAMALVTGTVWLGHPGCDSNRVNLRVITTAH